MISQKRYFAGVFVMTAITMLIAQSSVPDDSAMIDVTPSNKQHAALSISSSPSEAEIYINKKPGKRTSPDASTPATLKNIKIAPISLTLFKKGYSDTTIRLNLAPGTTKYLDIYMFPLHVDSIKSQNRFLRTRFHAKLGRFCFMLSPFLIAGGAGVLYYSKRCGEKADEAKSFLEICNIIIKPCDKDSIDAMQRQYSNETRKRNLTFIPGIVLSGLAAVDLGAGIILYF